MKKNWKVIIVSLIVCLLTGLTAYSAFAVVSNKAIIQKDADGTSSCAHYKKVGGVCVSCGKCFHSSTKAAEGNSSGHKMICEKCGQQVGTIKRHSYSGNTCTACGYTKAHTHSYSQKNTTSEYLKSLATCTSAAEYYYACSCGQKGLNTYKQGSALGHKYDSNTGICSSCGVKCSHSGATYSDKNDTTHKTKCAACKFEGYEKHIPDANGKCTVCKKTGIKKDATCKEHRYNKNSAVEGICVGCGAKCGHSEKTYSNKTATTHDETCKTCGFVKTGVNHSWNLKTGGTIFGANNPFVKDSVKCDCGQTNKCTHDWSAKNGVCPKCSYNCGHSYDQKAGTGVCTTCGAASCSHPEDKKSYEKATNFETEHMRKCGVCGFSKPEPHGNITYSNLKETTHKGICDICKQDWTVNHSWGEKTGICTRCSYNCGHAYDKKAGTGVCTTCGAASCSHPEDKKSYEKATNFETEHMRKCGVCGFSKPESHGKIAYSNKNETTHKGKCDVCKLEWKVNHSWGEKTGICTRCDYKCAHPYGKKAETGECTTCGFVCEHKQKVEGICVSCGECFHSSLEIGESTGYSKGHYCKCLKCGETLSGTYDHVFVNGICKCGYQCRHENKTGKNDEKEHWKECNVCGQIVEKNTHIWKGNWNNTTCTCGMTCTHEGSAYVPTENGKHAKKCNICGKDDGKENHIYTKAAEVGTGKCDLCGEPCDHTKYGTEKKYVDEKSHKIVCIKCGKGQDREGHTYKYENSLKIPADEKRNHIVKCDCGDQKEESHRFDAESKCTVCGYRCACTGGADTFNSEGICIICNRGCTHEDANYTDKTATTHKLECPDCGHIEEAATHKWIEAYVTILGKGMKCDDCGYECKHNGGYNYEVDTDKPDQKHTKICKICGKQDGKGNHVYTKAAEAGTGKCDLCGQSCDHTKYGTVKKPLNESGHKIACANCGKGQSAENHNYSLSLTYSYADSAKTHTLECEECGEKKEENHKPDAYGECTVCGFRCICSDFDAEGKCIKCGQGCTHFYGGKYPNEYKTETTHKFECDCGYEKTDNHEFGDDEECDDCGYKCKHSKNEKEYTYTRTVDGKHNKICKTCNKVVKKDEKCSWDKNEVFSIGTGLCKFCNEQCSHSNGNKNSPVKGSESGDQNKHFIVCKDCYKVREELPHKYQPNENYYEPLNDGKTHKQTCLCGFVKTEEHSFGTSSRTNVGRCIKCFYECTHNYGTDGKCTKCDYMEVCKHEYVWKKADEKQCKYACDVCGKTDKTQDHTYGPNKIIDATDHKEICTTCDYVKVEEHKYVWKKADEKQCKYACDVCGKTDKTQDHTYGPNKIIDATDHKEICTTCDYVKAEEHKYVWKQVDEKQCKYACDVCGKTNKTQNHTYKNGTCSNCGHKKAYTPNYSGKIELFELLADNKKELIKNKTSLEMEVGKELILEYTPKENFSKIEYKITKLDEDPIKDLEPVELQLKDTSGKYTELKFKLPSDAGKIKLEVKGKFLNGKESATLEYTFNLVKNDTSSVLDNFISNNNALINDMLKEHESFKESIVENNKQLIYGDANEDKNVDIEDALLVLKYASKGATLTEQGLKNADVNVDGKVDAVDSVIILRVDAGWDIKLPAVGYIVYGDVNEDGKIDGRDCLVLLKYVEGHTVEITEQGLKNADVNEDGKVNRTDSVIISAICADWDIELPAKGIVVYGDVDEDGVLSQKDIEKLTQYVEEKTSLSEQAKKNADFNGDNKVNRTDITSLKGYIASQKNQTNIQVLLEPGETVKETVYGDANEDEIVDLTDAVLILRYANKFEGTVITEQGLKNADVNVDGKVNCTDAIIINAVDAGWDIKLPAKGIVAHGDVDEDGVLSQKDVEKLTQYVEKTTSLSTQAKKNADFNGDNKVNSTDITSLKGYIASQKDQSNIQVLLQPGKTVKETVYGDANEDEIVDLTDAVLILRYANKWEGTTITEQGLKNADVNVDGKVNCTDAIIINAVEAGWDIELPAKGIVAHGDVDEDGVLSQKDIEKLTQYVEKTTSLSTQAKKNADFNGDNKVNSTDITSLKGYIASQKDQSNIQVLLQPGKTIDGSQCIDTQHNFNAEGVCSLCGYKCPKHTYDKNTGTCKECGVACVHSSLTFKKETATTHKQTCKNCGYSESVAHNFNPSTGKCACGQKYVCTHTFNTEGACSLCGYTCSKHTYDKNAGTGTCKTCGVACVHSNLGYKKEAATTHKQTCKDCGYSESVAHNFDTNTGKCACGEKYVCTHTFNTEGACSLCGYTCSKHIYDKNAGTGTCKTCGVACDHSQYMATYAKDTATTHKATCKNCGYVESEEHVFDTTGKCRACKEKYEGKQETNTEVNTEVVCSKHKYDKKAATGICTVCGIACSHSKVSYKKDTALAHKSTCKDCGYVQSVEHSFDANLKCTACKEKFVCPHKFNAEGACTVCGYKCTKHKYDKKAATGTCKECGAACSHSKVSYKKDTALAHKSTCKDCGYVQSVEHSFDANLKCTACKEKFVCPHKFNAEGACTVCGYKCTKHKYDKKAATGTCKECGAACSHSKVSYKKDTALAHKSTCKDCGYVQSVEHSFDANLKCTACKEKFVCPHKFNAEGACTVCGYKCTKHKYDKKAATGTCKECGAACSHSKVSYKKDTATEHKSTCKDCGYTQGEKHDFNEKGKCESCKYVNKAK